MEVIITRPAAQTTGFNAHIGNVFAGASLPYGMAKAVADTNSGSNQGGFVTDGSKVTGFSSMHDSGTGYAEKHMLEMYSLMFDPAEPRRLDYSSYSHSPPAATTQLTAASFPRSHAQSHM